MANIETASEADIAVITSQLGRCPRGLIGVAARCRTISDGQLADNNDTKSHPAVVATAPRLPSGEPFPTFYYLTCPEAVAACSHLEAEGVMREAEALLHDPEIAKGYQLAHEAFIAERNAALGPGEEVAEIANISAGGMPNRVKCFHAILAQRLAVGSGVNPIGDWLLSRLYADPVHPWSPETCTWHGKE